MGVIPLRVRKRPVEVEAFRFKNGDHADLLAEWCGGRVVWGPGPRQAAECLIVIPTLEGDVTARYGDWIIKGVKGEFYPCKPDIFAATYEEAE